MIYYITIFQLRQYTMFHPVYLVVAGKLLAGKVLIWKISILINYVISINKEKILVSTGKVTNYQTVPVKLCLVVLKLSVVRLGFYGLFSY